MASPIERTLRLLRREGYRAAVVERWNPHARVRVDLFGCIDVIAVGHGVTVGVQATTASNMAARVTKILTDPDVAPAALAWLQAGNIMQVVGWRKRGRFWEATVRQITLAELEDGAR
jgi:hypothetical protein